MLLSTVSQVPASSVSWHTKTADRLNAMVEYSHHIETFFRSLVAGTQATGTFLLFTQKHGSVSCRLADQISMYGSHDMKNESVENAFEWYR